MHKINSESGKILDHLCNKYPQTDTVDVNKKIKNMIGNLNINNWEDDDYDLLRKSGVNLKLKQDGDYSKEIMQYLNYLITLPYQKFNNELTNYQYFEKVMSRIFNVIMFKNRGKDIEKVVDSEGNFILHHKLKERKTLTEEEVEFMEKVEKYTKILIGAKVSENSYYYSSSDIDSGIVKVDNSSVARLLDKWADELKAKFDNVKGSILNRVHRFKGANPEIKHKLS